MGYPPVQDFFCILCYSYTADTLSLELHLFVLAQQEGEDEIWVGEVIECTTLPFRKDLKLEVSVRIANCLVGESSSNFPTF